MIGLGSDKKDADRASPDVEFVTKVTILACVKYFWPWVKFSRITAKQFLFCVFCLIQTRYVAASLQNMSKTFSSILNVLPKMSRFTCFSRVKLKTLGILLKYFFFSTNSTSGRAHYKSVFQEGGTTP